MERTLVLVKPDGVQRGLIGEIVARFERKGLKVAGLRLLDVSRSLAERHYAVHTGKHFYADLVAFITSGPVAVVALEGPDAECVPARLLSSELQPVPDGVQGSDRILVVVGPRCASAVDHEVLHCGNLFQLGPPDPGRVEGLVLLLEVDLGDHGYAAGMAFSTIAPTATPGGRVP